MYKNISPDSVLCGRTCPANLGVRSYPVLKLICPIKKHIPKIFGGWRNYCDFRNIFNPNRIAQRMALSLLISLYHNWKCCIDKHNFVKA